MERSNEVVSIANIFANFIFFTLTFFGTIGLIEQLGEYGDVDNQTVTYACFFIVGAFGFIAQLFIHNLKLMKK